MLPEAEQLTAVFHANTADSSQFFTSPNVESVPILSGEEILNCIQRDILRLQTLDGSLQAFRALLRLYLFSRFWWSVSTLVSARDRALDFDLALARARDLDRDRALVDSVLQLNWLCVIEKRALGDLSGAKGLWLARIPKRG